MAECDYSGHAGKHYSEAERLYRKAVKADASHATNLGNYALFLQVSAESLIQPPFNTNPITNTNTNTLTPTLTLTLRAVPAAHAAAARPCGELLQARYQEPAQPPEQSRELRVVSQKGQCVAASAP